MRLLPLFLIAGIAVPATTLPARQVPRRQVSARQVPGLAQPVRRPDLADTVAGTYAGAVIADARGSSGRQVVVRVTRVAKNVVELSFDYPRVPTVRIPIQRAMDAIVAASGHDNFLIEQAKDPHRLDLSIDGVTMILHKS